MGPMSTGDDASFQIFAIAFYESLGFNVCGYHRRLVDWDGELLDAVEIEKWLD